MKFKLQPMYGKPRCGDIHDSVSDITVVKKTLGYPTHCSPDKGHPRLSGCSSTISQGLPGSTRQGFSRIGHGNSFHNKIPDDKNPVHSRV